MEFKINPKLATLNQGIPNRETNKQLNFLGIETKNNREGIHLYIGHYELEPINEGFGVERVLKSQSVHLTREDAMNLIKEIQERLF